MKQGGVFTRTNTKIGLFTFDTHPYGDVEEERQGTLMTDYQDGRGLVLEDKPVKEWIAIVHTIEWLETRAYPDEVALVYGYPGNYYEIGKRVNNTWISAGVISEFSCLDEDIAAGATLVYDIIWGKAFKRLPDCFIRIDQTAS